MADERLPMSSPTLDPDDRVPANASLGLTRAEYDALVTELHERRRIHHDELADRLRDARAHGSPGDDDDVLAVHEDGAPTAERL